MSLNLDFHEVRNSIFVLSDCDVVWIMTERVINTTHLLNLMNICVSVVLSHRNIFAQTYTAENEQQFDLICAVIPSFVTSIKEQFSQK